MQSEKLGSFFFLAIYRPSAAFGLLVGKNPDPYSIFFRYSIWLLLLPPLMAWVGASSYGWRLGADEPLVLSDQALMTVSIAYFLVLVVGFVSTIVISRWMATTYDAKDSAGLHLAYLTVVIMPLALASVAHLFPDVFINVLVLVPTMIWSMYLLYSGIPVALEVPHGKGMLMASALVGWLLVGAVSILGISVGLWASGIGPFLGV